MLALPRSLVGGRRRMDAAQMASVLVVMLVVRRVPACVVHIVDMIPVRHRDMAASLTVDVVRMLVHRVRGWLALVVVILVLPMKVAVVHVVDVISMWNRYMAASFTMHMIVLDVLVVHRGGHRFHRPIESRLRWCVDTLVPPHGR
jgi:hypothetical protein